MKSATERNNRIVLFVPDNFKDSVSAIGGLVWYGVPNATDLRQTVDPGFGELLKVLAKQEHNRWLDCDENIDRWQGRIQTTSTYANAEVISSVVKLLKNTGIPIFSTKLLSSFLLPIEEIRKS